METPVAVLGAADRATMSSMLARAFADDPAMTHIFPDPAQRAKRLPRLFALLFDADANSGMRLGTRGGEAATLWRAPGHLRTGRLAMLRQAIPMLATFGTALGRALAVSDAIEAHFPEEPCWYLHIAGCDPAWQGRGFGGAAIRSGLARGAGRLPCYLETATERNLGLYSSLGFRVTGEYRVEKGGPLFWSMLRLPTAISDRFRNN